MSWTLTARAIVRGSRGRMICWLVLVLAACAASPVDAGEQKESDSLASARARAFMEEAIVCDRYVFQPGPLPGVRWEHPERVRELIGTQEVSVTYYNKEMRQVTRAESPGRYGAVARARMADGFEAVRYVTLFCTETYLDDYSPVVPCRMLPFTGSEIPRGAWEGYATDIRRFSFGDLLTFPARSQDAAVFLAGMSDWDSTKGAGWTPRKSDAQWWVNFKRGQSRSLPGRIPDPVPAVEASRTLQAAGSAVSAYTPADVGRLDSVCRRWADGLGEPLVTLVAHRGTIVFHRGYAPGGTSIPVPTPMWMASITKLLMGVLVTMADEQGIISLDDPLADCIQECAGRSPASLTPRRLMTHTADLGWSGDWASDWNQSLENQISQIAPTLRVGERFEYNRAGYAVMGKVLEQRSGLPVSVLLERCLVRPLGMEHAFVDNSYGGLYASALDVARLGQMLLNGGFYGKSRFLAPKSVEAMRPKPFAESGLNIPGSRGIGTHLVKGPGLSESAYGHSAASGAVFCIDPELDLVIVSARDRVGPDEAKHREFTRELFEAATTPVRTRSR